MVSKSDEKKVRKARILSILVLNDDMDDNLGLIIGEEYTKALSTKEIQDLFDKSKHLDRWVLGKEIKIASIRGDLKELSKEGVIHEEKKVLLGATTYTNFYCLKKDIHTFFKVLNMVMEPYQDSRGVIRGSQRHGADLVSSSYGKFLINMDLIKWFENKLRVEFSEIEKDTILKAFKTFPNSLWSVSDYTRYLEQLRYDYERFEVLDNGDVVWEEDGEKTIIDKEEFEILYDKERMKKAFIFWIQLGIGKDIESSNISSLGSDFLVNYEVKITFTPANDLENEDPILRWYRSESYINDKGDIIQLKKSVDGLPND